jgi:hypothetical protein
MLSKFVFKVVQKIIYRTKISKLDTLIINNYYCILLVTKIIDNKMEFIYCKKKKQENVYNVYKFLDFIIYKGD